MCFVTVDFLRKVKWYVVTTVRNGFISLALILVYQMRMTGFAVVVVVDCLHDLILFMQHNIIIMMMIYCTNLNRVYTHKINYVAN